ncbi:hypothetical protein D3C75_753020 [compost metagenome]
MQHLSGADDAFDQMNGLFRLLLGYIVLRFYGLDQKIAPGADNLPDFLLLLLGNGAFAQLDKNVNDRAGEDILMCFFQLCSQIPDYRFKRTTVIEEKQQAVLDAFDPDRMFDCRHAFPS